MSLWLAIKDCAREHPSGSARLVAQHFIEKLAHEELVTLVAKAIIEARRELVLDLERGVFSGMPAEIAGFDQEITQRGVLRPSSREAPSRGDFAALLDQTFALGKGHVVSWGLATVAQHRQRIELLMKFVDGTLKTIRQHETAIEVLQVEKVTCLNRVKDLSQVFDRIA